MRKTLFLVGVILGVAVAVVLLVGRGAVREEAILLELQVNGTQHIFEISPDGTGFQALVWSDDAYETTISPDGRYAATLSLGGAYLVDLDTGQKTRLPKGKHIDFLPEFSPDGRMTVTETGRSDTTGVQFTVEDLRSHKRHSFSVERAWNATFSPDGKTLAITGGDWPSYKIWLADLNGNNRRLLAIGEGPVFSPDGKTVAFTREVRGKEGAIFLIDVDGKNERQLVTPYSRAFYPVFSPDGKKLLFRREQGSAAIGLSIADIDGTHVRSVADVAMVSGAVFGPDGRSFAYSTDSGGTFVASTSGAQPRLLTPYGGSDLYWGPKPRLSPIPRPSFPGLPDGYLVDRLVTGDFDGDGVREQACTAAVPESPVFLERRKHPIIVLVAKGKKLLARFEEKEANAVTRLQAVDLTGDGLPELTYNTDFWGADNVSSNFRAYRWAGGRFGNIIGTKEGTLFHFDMGGLVAINDDKAEPSTLVLYDFIWGANEGHPPPHRYWMETNELKHGKFVRTERKETKHKYDTTNPLVEFGINLTSESVTLL